MVDNRIISPIANTGFKQDNASANKMSEEKYGQGGEYFSQEMQEEDSQENQQFYQDRSAQLRASLNGLAAQNAGSIMFLKTLKKREVELNKKNKNKESKEEKEEQEEEFQEN